MAAVDRAGGQGRLATVAVAAAAALGAAGLTYLATAYRIERRRRLREAVEDGVELDSSGKTVRSTTASGSVVYEAERAVHEYLQFHYAPAEELCPYPNRPEAALRFPERCAELCIKHAPNNAGSGDITATTRAADVGCAVGGAAFALARGFDEVIGIDYSHAFIGAASTMKERGSMPYTFQVEGDITARQTAQVATDIDRSKVSFRHGDACALSVKELGQFDCILAANLLCRLPRPDNFIHFLPSLVKPGGTVVFLSPYSWLEEYTPRHHWVGGLVKGNGEPLYSANALTKMTDLGFQLIHESDEPFLIREHRRKFQWGCSHATVWQKT
eukprot:jgi/Chlat1/797/Chrsp104S00031